MYPLNYFLFLQIILFLFITPGTPRIVIISYSMNYGVQKCVWTALGDVTANIIQATLVIFVIGSFFSDNSTLLNAFKWIGVAYILYLAYDLYKSEPKDIILQIFLQKVFFLFLKMVFWLQEQVLKLGCFFL
jgi:homoserine/homoserine lactone efflux protein